MTENNAIGDEVISVPSAMGLVKMIQKDAHEMAGVFHGTTNKHHGQRRRRDSANPRQRGEMFAWGKTDEPGSHERYRDNHDGKGLGASHANSARRHCRPRRIR